MRVLLIGSTYVVDEALAGLRSHPHIRVVGSSGDPLEAREMAQELGPNVIVVDEEIDDALGVAGRLARTAPGALVFLITARPNLDLIRKAASHGVRDILRKPLDGFELVRAVEQARSIAQERVQKLAAADEEPGDASIAPATGGPVFLRQELIVVHSPKGGVGKTAISLNLAVAYIQAGGRGTRVLLVDFDPFGNLVGTIVVEGAATVADWVGLDGLPSRSDLDILTGLHKATGLRVLLSPRSMVDADVVDAATAERILQSARQHFDVVVVDCGNKLQDAQVVAMEHATRILEITLPEVPTLRALNDLRDYLDALGVDQAKIRTVLNRLPKRPDLPVREVGEMLPWPLVARIPDDTAVPAAANRGEVLVVAKPDAPFAQEVRKLAGATAAVRHGPGRRGFLARLLGRH